MFVISCKESGCVKLTCTQNPKDVMKLSPNVDTYFNILEFDDNTDYTGKYLKVVNGALVDLGYVKDLEGTDAIEDCGNCPPLFE
jgi:hypothetical protein